ncbi:MAG: hypothetical protein DHS20C02_02610 [Micavibrio sp.]|nr:MAG: hypothetical protein DHS20C02_02610 [Micavibrio sp.]
MSYQDSLWLILQQKLLLADLSASDVLVDEKDDTETVLSFITFYADSEGILGLLQELQNKIGTDNVAIEKLDTEKEWALTGGLYPAHKITVVMKGTPQTIQLKIETNNPNPTLSDSPASEPKPLSLS